MIRDFSNAKKEELYRNLDVIDNKEWRPFMIWCGGRAGEFGVWADKLGISSYTRQIDNYQNRVLNTNDSTRNQIDVIFENVGETDRRYAEIFCGYAETVKEQMARVQVMIQVMNTVNGNEGDRDIATLLQDVADTFSTCVSTEKYNYMLESGREILERRLKGEENIDQAEWEKICETIEKEQPNMLINLYITDRYSGADSNKVYDVIVRYYKYKDVNYFYEQICEEDVFTKEQMFSLNTYDLLARMIYQEMQNPENGRQSKVLWATINRYFSEKNFTYGRERTLRIILEEGGYESIDINEENEYNAYHPNYKSEAWKNAKLLAAILYSQIGEANADDVDEEKVREAISTFQDIYGNNIENTIGNCDSFYGDGKENYFYEQ